MPRYLAGHNRDRGGVEVLGTVEAADIAAATFTARQKFGDVGVMPPRAVAVWMRRGAAVNEMRCPKETP